MLSHRFTDLTARAAWAARASVVLSAAELERAQRFRQSVDRDRYIIAHVGLRLMLAETLGIDPADVAIASAPCAHCGGPHGRPELPPSTGLYFSMSRSRDFAAYAVAGEPVGIDIETVPPQAATEEMRIALHVTELAALDALPADQRKGAIMRCWVRKEAALKATGHGLTIDPATVGVGFGAAPHQVQIGHRSVRSITDLEAPTGYASALALADPVPLRPALPARPRALPRPASQRGPL